MTDDDRVWALAYLRGQLAIVDADPWPTVPLDALFALVNIGDRIRQVTRDAESVYELGLRRLVYATDDMLGVLLVPGDEANDAETVREWRRAHSELQEILR